jgi:hypothetical protein
MVFIILFLIALIAIGIILIRLPAKRRTAGDAWFDPDIHSIFERIADGFQNIIRDALRAFLIWILHIYQRVGARVQMTTRIKKILRTHLYEHSQDGIGRKSPFLHHLSHAQKPRSED